MKKFIKIPLIIFAVLIIFVAGFVLYLTLTALDGSSTHAETVHSGGASVAVGDTLEILSWNIGYAALGETEDFFMDGGERVRPESAETVRDNLNAIKARLLELGADVYFLQEVDADSRRSYRTDEKAELVGGLGTGYSYALNFKCDFVPFPLPPIGRVESGVMTLTELSLEASERVPLPSPFSWPVSTANLKRCLLVSRVPVEGTDKELVLINLHLEAYDDGEGKRAQTELLRNLIAAECEKGSYVIAGGDFNQFFPGALDAYPMLDESYWTPGSLDGAILPDGCSFQYDLAVPSCRLLDAPLSESTQLYVIDGFIVSENVSVSSVQTLDEGFVNSDHNPVLLSVTLN